MIAMQGATSGIHRDYSLVRSRLGRLAGLSREAKMAAFVDAVWDAFRDRGVSWVGFYLAGEDRASMVLGPRRDKPACSPIGLHGACGQCFRSGAPLVVRDVAELGEGYIACDPRDRSEVVLPLFDAERPHLDAGGSRGCWGVLDVDSHEVGAFTRRDADELAALLRDVGLSAR
ncbi:MAG: GAF domain-containing protein [Phycisphaerales bacterium]|nr:GAF domain-containing protein [Phycisphaerales bacterium]